MNWDNYRQFLLSNIPRAKLVSGGSHINCRCFDCPDSRNPNTGHFYISIPKNNNEPSLYYCHKCGSSGVVTHNTLISWGIYDQQLALELNAYNKIISGSGRAKKYFNSQIYEIRHTYTTIDAKSEEKRRYIVDRVGYDLSFDDLNQLKIITNIGDIIRENNITTFTRNENIVFDLDKEFIGFLSIDNGFLNMRRTCNEGVVYKEIDKRYINYNIFNKLNTTQRFYTIPTRVNLNTPERIKLNIAEGPFDILSIYLNCRNRTEGIYAAASGNNFISIILYFLTTYRLPYIELHIYADNDKYGNIDRLNRNLAQIPDISFPIYVHKNNSPGQKDFGVPKNKIIESSIRIR